MSLSSSIIFRESWIYFLFVSVKLCLKLYLDHKLIFWLCEKCDSKYLELLLTVIKGYLLSTTNIWYGLTFILAEKWVIQHVLYVLHVLCVKINTENQDELEVQRPK